MGDASLRSAQAPVAREREQSLAVKALVVSLREIIKKQIRTGNWKATFHD
jgi:hypothetical protein